MPIKVAVVQAEPVWYDLQGSVAKANQLIIEASSKGAELIAFPEVFIPGYPQWIWKSATDFARNMKYVANSLSLDSEEFQSILDTVKANPIHVVLGLSEKDNGSLYISQVVINKDGVVVLKRRKIKPTHVERVIYGDGKTSDLESVTLLDFNDYPKPVEVGCLNCWEHVQPLLTFNSATKHEKIHIGSWPPLCTHENFSLSKPGCQNVASTYAIQTQAFYLFSTAVTSAAIEKEHDVIAPIFGIGGGCAAVFGPNGAKISEDLDETTDGILYQTIDLADVAINKHLIDLVGHYSKTEMMSLNIHGSNENLTHST